MLTCGADVICRHSGMEAKLTAANEAMSVEGGLKLAGSDGLECLAEE